LSGWVALCRKSAGWRRVFTEKEGSSVGSFRTIFAPVQPVGSGPDLPAVAYRDGLWQQYLGDAAIRRQWFR
jgi:hypothetical protein